MDAAPQLARLDSSEEGRLRLDPTKANFESDENYESLLAPGHEDRFGYHAPVRSYPPNRWLIHDMLGNVSEWVTTNSGSRLSAIGGSYVDKHTADHRTPSTRDQTAAREEIGIRIVVTAAPSRGASAEPDDDSLDAQEHVKLGFSVSLKKDYDAAIKHFNAALRINPDDAKAHEYLAGALKSRKDYDAAIEHFNAALLINPDNASALAAC